MFESVEQYLQNVVSPERVTLLLEACQALWVAGITRHVAELESILDVVDDTGTEATVASIHEVLVTMVESALNQFGVMVTDEAELGVMAGALRGLSSLDNYSDVATVRQTCEAGLSNEETLGELLMLVTEYTADDYLQTFETVAPSLFTRLLAALHESPVLADAVDNTYIRVRVRSLLQLYPNLLIRAEVNEGLRLGTPLGALLDAYAERLQELPWTERAIELIGLVLLSPTPDQRLQTVIKDHMEDVFPNINDLTKASMLITTILPKVSYE